MKQYILKAIDTRSMHSQLTTSKEYTTLEGIEKDTSDNGWKFPDYVTILGDNRLPLSCHASRFEAVKELDDLDV